MAESAFRYLRFKPRLVDALRGYSRDDFIADLGSGITVAIIALPLAMAFGIASGVRPEQGIVTAIIAGFPAGIAVIIAISQVRDFLGIDVPKMPANFFSQLDVIAQNIETANVHAI